MFLKLLFNDLIYIYIYIVYKHIPIPINLTN